MKVTQWFPGLVKPARKGLYQVLMPRSGEDSVEWCYWDGAWGWAYGTKRWALAKDWRKADGAIQAKTWRGVKHRSHARFQQMLKQA